MRLQPATSSVRRSNGELVAGDGGVDELRPGVDSPTQIVEIRESRLKKVLRGGLAADAVVTLKDKRHGSIEAEQMLVVRAIQQPRAVDVGHRPFLLGTDVDQFDNDLAVAHGLELEDRELPDAGRLVGVVDRDASAFWSIHALGDDAQACSAITGSAAAFVTRAILPVATSIWAVVAILCPPSTRGMQPRTNCAARSLARVTNSKALVS